MTPKPQAFKFICMWVRNQNWVINRVINILSVLLLGTTVSLNSFAGGENSGGAQKIHRSFFSINPKTTFKTMSDTEVLNARFLEKEIWNINLPGTSTWYNPLRGLCIDEGTVQTVYPARYQCLEWEAKTKSGELKYFTNKSQARRLDKNEDPKCSAPVYRFLAVSDDKMPHSFSVDFYFKKDGKFILVGSREYPIKNCIDFKNRDPRNRIQQAGGENSGGAVINPVVFL